MELFISRFLPVLLFLTQESLSVIVTLENGATSTYNKEVAIGTDAVILRCSVVSSGVGGIPHLQWTKASNPSLERSLIYDDNAIQAGNWSLDKFYLQSPFSLGIRDIDSSDNGYYKCKAELPGDVPSVDSATYNLRVLAPPSGQLSCGFPSDFTIDVGESAEFHCTEVVKQAYPAPVFKWFKDGVELPKLSANNSLSHDLPVFYNAETGILKFQNVISEDAGNYFCTSTNKVGTSRCAGTEISTRQFQTSINVPFLALLLGGAALLLLLFGGVLLFRVM